MHITTRRLVTASTISLALASCGGPASLDEEAPLAFAREDSPLPTEDPASEPSDIPLSMRPLAAHGVGGPCSSGADCSGAACLRDASWVDGYCTAEGCSPGSCASGSHCFRFSDGKNRCLRACASNADCRGGYKCASSAGLSACVPGAPATDACASLPPRDCTGSAAYCATIVPFEPVVGLGYKNDPVNGETWQNQWRSYARRDLVTLVRYATAFVACRAKTWAGGNGQPLGLGDMSEKNGATPGTAIGQLGHPVGTHVAGNDMDIAYYQTASVSSNALNAVCPHVIGGVDQYHCVGEPTTLDLWRTALFIGALFTSDRVRVIGVDGKIGPKVKSALAALCQDGHLQEVACSRASSLLGYETTNTGLGWYAFHHHHLHVSLRPVQTTTSLTAAIAPATDVQMPSIVPFSPPAP